MNKAHQVGKQFDERAKQYDNPLTAFIGERELRAIRKMLPPRSNVLDYGCGTGRTTQDLLRRGCSVTAYDISAEMLRRAMAKAQEEGFKAEFTTEESTILGRKWPVVTCIGVLDYYVNPVPLLNTLRRFLEPDGILVVTYPNALSPLGWVYALTSHFTVHSYLKSPRSVRWLATQAGLKVFKLEYAFPALAPFGHTIVAGMIPKNP